MSRPKATKAPVMPSGNLAFAVAMHGKGGNLTHADKRTRRNRTRSAQRNRAIRDHT